jgi:uncharacterized protein (DUF1778 family)
MGGTAPRIYDVLTAISDRSILSAWRAKTVANTEVINLRIPSEHKALIDLAASLAGKNRTAFIVENAVRSAEEMLLDRTQFRLSPEQWEKFNAALDEPVRSNPAFAKLLAVTAPWED